MLKGAVISKVKAAVAFPLKNIAALIFKHFADCNLRSCVAESSMPAVVSVTIKIGACMSGLLSCVASYCPLLLSWSPHVCFTPLMTQHFYLSMESVYIFTFYLIFWIYLGYFLLLNLISVACITCNVLWEKRASFYNNIITIMVFAPFYKWQTSTAGTWMCSASLFLQQHAKTHTPSHTFWCQSPVPPHPRGAPPFRLRSGDCGSHLSSVNWLLCSRTCLAWFCV